MDGGDASARSKVWVGKRGSPAVARLGPKNEWASCLVVKTLKDQGQVLLLADNGDEVSVHVICPAGTTPRSSEVASKPARNLLSETTS